MRRVDGQVLSKSPSVSVNMVVRDGERYITAAIQSVLDQSFPDFELIIVDDHSSDRTRSIADGFAAADLRVRVLTNAGDGQTDARNHALAESRGDYIAVLDSDDLALPDRLEVQKTFLDTNPDHCLVCGSLVLIDEDGQEIEKRSYPDGDVRLTDLQDGNRIAHPCVMARRASMIDAGGYRLAFAEVEDYDLWLRMARRGALRRMSHMVTLYRRHDGAISYRKRAEQMFRTIVASAASRDSASPQLRQRCDGPVIGPEVLALPDFAGPAYDTKLLEILHCYRQTRWWNRTRELMISYRGMVAACLARPTGVREFRAERGQYRRIVVKHALRQVLNLVSGRGVLVDKI